MPHRRCDIIRQQGGQGGRDHHAAQGEHFAHRCDTDAFLRSCAEFGTPGVIVDGGQAEAGESDDQAQHQPRCSARGRRCQQGGQPECEERQGESDEASPVAQAIAPLSQQRIDQGIGKTRQQEYGADHR